MTGQGGVPTMSFNGEPFFGQDRFDQFFWRLRENGLTQRKVRREPIVVRPLRWPAGNRKRKRLVGELASSHPAGTGQGARKAALVSCTEGIDSTVRIKNRHDV